MVTSVIEATLPWGPEDVWQMVTDLRHTAWRSDLSRVEERGPRSFVEYTREGFPTRVHRHLRRALPALGSSNASENGQPGGGTGVGTAFAGGPALGGSARLALREGRWKCKACWMGWAPL
mgnify:CR=1 FL=1